MVNVVTAKPTDQFEAMLSADLGNYKNRRYEGMVNIPVVDDRLDIRMAGEWTKRDGYTFDETTGKQIDGRDLWSSRVTVGFKPVEGFEADLVWEHFSEDDDRLRSGKQLCKTDPGPDSIGPINQNINFPGAGFLSPIHLSAGSYITNLDTSGHAVLSQGCLPVSLYSLESRETPNGQALPIVYAAEFGSFFYGLMPNVEPYLSAVQPDSLRVIQSALTPQYKAKNDTIELNVSYNVTPSLTFTSNSGYNHDFLASLEDFNRFTSRPDIFFSSASQTGGGAEGTGTGVFGVRFTPGGTFCDPQLGCSNEFEGEDLSQEHAFQISQEFRLASNFSGPLNFSVGANYLHYETLEDFYVFLNLITLESRYTDLDTPPTADGQCQFKPQSHIYPVINESFYLFGCPYTDPTPLTLGFNGQGHNYFRSENPYRLNSYAGFGEVYYQVQPDLKLTGGLRWTSDQKHFTEIPSEVLNNGWGYPSHRCAGSGVERMDGPRGRGLDTQARFHGPDACLWFVLRGYKAGGANPPPPNLFNDPLRAVFGRVRGQSSADLQAGIRQRL